MPAMVKYKVASYKWEISEKYEKMRNGNYTACETEKCQKTNDHFLLALLQW